MQTIRELDSADMQTALIWTKTATVDELQNCCVKSCRDDNIIFPESPWQFIINTLHLLTILWKTPIYRNIRGADILSSMWIALCKITLFLDMFLFSFEYWTWWRLVWLLRSISLFKLCHNVARDNNRHTYTVNLWSTLCSFCSPLSTSTSHIPTYTGALCRVTVTDCSLTVFAQFMSPLYPVHY